MGLPLRGLAEDDAVDSVDREASDNVRREGCERRDICPLNTEGTPLEALPEEACWSIGPVELELGELQRQFDGRLEERVPLRSLFTRC